MQQEAVFYPLLALVGHTFLVWCWMYVDRLRAIVKYKVPMSAFRDQRTAASTPGGASTSSDNLRNLFELPVLFYAAAIILFITHNVTPAVLWLSWAFVLGRIVHSLIHISYNRVMHRFYIYIASSLVLWALWIDITAGLLFI